MEKNKNRTDLLAAGRKKLQQYRQKKDGKGSKSSGKASRHDHDVVVDEASSTAKPAKGKKQLPVAEGPVQGLTKELVDSPSQGSMDSPVPANAAPSNVVTEVSKVGEDVSSFTILNDNDLDALVPAKGLQKSNSYNGMTTISSSDTVNVEDKPESGHMPVMPVGLKALLDYANASGTDEVKSARGEDQVPDVGTMQEDNNSAVEPGNGSSLMDLDGGANPASSVDERVQVDSRDVQEATKMVNEQTIEPDSFPAFAGTRDDPEATKADVYSASPHSVPISDGFPASTPEPSNQLKEHVLTVVHGDEDIKLPPTSGFSLSKSGSSEFHERLIEHLYITNFEKEVVCLQLCEQSNVQEFDYHHLQGVSDKLAVATSFEDVQRKNKYLSNELAQCRSELDIVKCEREELQNHFSSSKTELSRFSARIDELLIELDRSKYQLSNVSSDLVDCRGLLADLQVKNEDLNAHVASLMEEKNKLQKEKEDGALEKENSAKELMECNALLEQSRVDNVNARGSLAHLTEERTKLEEEKQYYIRENDKLLAELGEQKRSVEAFQLENADLNGTLTSERENRSKLETENEHLVQEKDKLYAELFECHRLVETLRSENANLNGSLDLVTKERSRLGDEIGRLKIEMEENATNCKTLMKGMQVEYEKGLDNVKDSTPSLEQLTTLKDDQLKWDVFEDSSGFVALKRHLFEVEKLMQKLEKAIEEMHSHAVSLSRSSGKAVAPVVSKLIQAFESKGHADDELEELPLREDSDLYTSTKEQITNLKDLFKDLVLDVENASELFKGERSGKTLSDTRVRELRLHLEDLKEQNDNLEETFIKQVVLDEVVKQYVCTVESKKGEFVVLYEDLKQEESVTKAKNYELTGKLCNFESSISELQVQVDELQQQLQNAASLNHQMEILHRTLDASTGTMSTLSNATSDSQDVGSRVATSVDAAVAVIQDLHTKLEDAQRNYNLLSRSHEDMAEKTKNLEETSELASDVLHKIYDNLQKLVNPSTVESQNHEKLLHPLQISNYDALIVQLEKLILEKGQLESMNREHLSELLERKKDIEELNRKCLNADLIEKLLGYIESVVKLEDIEIKVDEPVSSIESMIHFLTERCRSAEEQVGMFKEKLKRKEMRLVELQDETNHLSLSIIAYENEGHIFKESLRSAMEQLVSIQSEIQLKETELQQSEHRVSGLREKLHIAVTKGKGLISQRDSLKQSLAATSSELEKCLHELKSKDATLRETETKLKTYSEAGERMEALESELSYIRNSATALRESFLLKDSVLQRIEEILEDLELPEQFHAMDIIEKVDWLARSVSENSFPDSSWKEDPQSASVSGDELRRNYEELQSKFYGLAEQSEMLEQSLMERNNLVQRWEEILDKINVPPQLRSLELEDKIEWLQSSLSEANSHCDSLQHNIYNLENVNGSLTADLEDSKRRLVDLESALSLITNEREHLSASLEVVSHDYDKVSEKAALYETENAKLQNEIGVLQSKLDEKSVDEEHIRHLHGEIRRLQDLINDVLQDPETEDLDSSTSDVQRLEGLLRKLVDKYTMHPFSQHVLQEAVEEHTTEQPGNLEELGPSVMEQKLEEVEGDLMRVKEERDRHEEKNINLVHQVEALEVKNQELQKLLMQEEQKSASVKEKLNVAVRKGKSLVQQRDSMRQNINDLTSEVERLNSELKLRENTLSTFKERTEELESEMKFLRDRLAKADSELKDERRNLSMILGVVADIDLGVELRINDPVEKLEQIDKVLHKLHAEMSSSELDVKKSKRAAELLVAELNEVNERNEDLQEELSKATMEISELSKEKDLAEAARSESLAHLEQLSALHSEERSSEFSELMVLKSGLDQLKMVFIEIDNLLNDVLPRDLDILYNLKSNMKSVLESSDTSNMGSQTLRGAPSVAISRSENKVKFLHSESLLAHKMEEQFGENKMINLLKSVGGQLQDLTSAFEEKLRNHSKSLREEVVVLSETMNTVRRQMSSHENSLESLKEEIAQLESTGKQKEKDNLMMHRFISMLYEACKTSIIEIEKCKSQLVENISTAEASITIEGGDISEERITNIVNRLLSLVKDFHSIRAESVEVSQNEMKATISSLQKELREKDIEKDRICMELVSQIKQAEAAFKNKLQELEAAKDNINDLQEQLEAVNEKCNVLEHRVKDLEGQEAILVDLQEKVKSVTDELRAKEQEAEALLHALDEEEAQMEDLTNKITELERLVKQKDLDLESSEASRGKALKKLSVTVSKFDELHHLSATLLSEVEKLQSQVQERDSEISFLRDEITRCTSDSLLASKSDERSLDEIREILTWLNSMISGVQKNDVYLDENSVNQIHEHKEILQKQITSIVSELEDLREVAQIKDDLLSTERSRVEDLKRKGEFLENSLREKESQLSMHQNVGESAQPTTTSSEIVEVEPVVNKWTKKGTAVAPQVRSLRKINNEQLAISINDVDSDNNRDKLQDEDDDKAHGFKSLTTSKIVPRFTRPVTNLIDGLWVSCDRALMRQPLLRLSLIIYWAVMHALLAIFVV